MSTSTKPALSDGEAASLLVKRVRKYSEHADNTLLCAFRRIVPAGKTVKGCRFLPTDESFSRMHFQSILIRINVVLHRIFFYKSSRLKFGFGRKQLDHLTSF